MAPSEGSKNCANRACHSKPYRATSQCAEHSIVILSLPALFRRHRSPYFAVPATRSSRCPVTFVLIAVHTRWKKIVEMIRAAFGSGNRMFNLPCPALA